MFIRGRAAPLCWWSVYKWGTGDVGGPGSSCSSSRHVHSPTEYSYVADWGKSHMHSLCDPLHHLEQHVFLGLQPAVSQTLSSPAPAPSELLGGSSSVDRPRGGPLHQLKQNQWPEPSTKQPRCLDLLARYQSLWCSRNTVNHHQEDEDSGCHLCPVSTLLHQWELHQPKKRGEYLRNVSLRQKLSLVDSKKKMCALSIENENESHLTTDLKHFLCL